MVLTVDDQDEENNDDAGCEGGSGAKAGERGRESEAEPSAEMRFSDS